MSPDQERTLKRLIDEKLEPVLKRIDEIAGQRFLLLVALVLALLIAVGTLVTLLLVSNQLTDQLDINREYGCAAANTSAVSPVEQQESENRDEFINRMIARRAQLVQASRLNCTELPGFETFPYSLGRALAKIDALLQREAPQRLRNIESDEAIRSAPGGHNDHTFFTPSGAPVVIPASDDGGNGSGPSQGLGDSPSGSGPIPQQPGGSGGGGKNPSAGGGGGSGSDPSPSPTPVQTAPEVQPDPAPQPRPAPEPAPEPEPEPEPAPESKGSGALPLICEIEVLGKPLVCLR